MHIRDYAAGRTVKGRNGRIYAWQSWIGGGEHALLARVVRGRVSPEIAELRPDSLRLLRDPPDPRLVVPVASLITLAQAGAAEPYPCDTVEAESLAQLWAEADDPAVLLWLAGRFATVADEQWRSVVDLLVEAGAREVRDGAAELGDDDVAVADQLARLVLVGRRLSGSASVSATVQSARGLYLLLAESSLDTDEAQVAAVACHGIRDAIPCPFLVTDDARAARRRRRRAQVEGRA